MKLDVYVHLLTAPGEDSKKLDSILKKLSEIQTLEITMAGVLDELVAKVEANGNAVSSAIAALQGIKAKLDEAIASNDPAKLQELSDALGAQSTALADAVVANTPASP